MRGDNRCKEVARRSIAQVYNRTMRAPGNLDELTPWADTLVVRAGAGIASLGFDVRVLDNRGGLGPCFKDRHTEQDCRVKRRKQRSRSSLY